MAHPRIRRLHAIDRLEPIILLVICVPLGQQRTPGDEGARASPLLHEVEQFQPTPAQTTVALRRVRRAQHPALGVAVNLGDCFLADPRFARDRDRGPVALAVRLKRHPHTDRRDEWCLTTDEEPHGLSQRPRIPPAQRCARRPDDLIQRGRELDRWREQWRYGADCGFDREPWHRHKHPWRQWTQWIDRSFLLVAKVRRKPAASTEIVVLKTLVLH